MRRAVVRGWTWRLLSFPVVSVLPRSVFKVSRANQLEVVLEHLQWTSGMVDRRIEPSRFVLVSERQIMLSDAVGVGHALRYSRDLVHVPDDWWHWDDFHMVGVRRPKANVLASWLLALGLFFGPRHACRQSSGFKVKQQLSLCKGD